MLLSQIEAMAGKGNIATGAFNVRNTLRFEVIPEFYRHVGDVTWLRRGTTITVVPGERTFRLPRDFRSVISAGGKERPLCYIGEDPVLVARAEAQQTASCPRGYYIVKDAECKWRAIKFDAPSDMEYLVPLVYRSRLSFGNDADEVELDEFIPEDYQQALLQGLKAEIYLDRYGQGDERYKTAAARFIEICEQAKEGAHDLAQRNYAVYCD